MFSLVWDASAQSLVFLPFWKFEMIFSNFKIEIEKITNKFLEKLEIENRNIFSETVDFFSPGGFLLIYVSSAFAVSLSVLESHYR